MFCVKVRDSTCVPHVCVLGAYGGQKKASDPRDFSFLNSALHFSFECFRAETGTDSNRRNSQSKGLKIYILHSFICFESSRHPQIR